MSVENGSEKRLKSMSFNCTLPSPNDLAERVNNKLEYLYDNNYEIVDVKMAATSETVHVLILYK